MNVNLQIAKFGLLGMMMFGVSLETHAQSNFLSPSGITYPTFTTSNRPAANSVGVGTVLYNTSDNTHQFSNGSTWLNLLGTSSVPSGTANQTLRNNGSGWVADGLMQNDGMKVIVGSGGTYVNAVLNAYSAGSAAILGEAPNHFAVSGTSTNSYGVYGTSENSVAMYGYSANGTAIVGFSNNSYGGEFTGRLRLKRNVFGDAGIFFSNNINANVGYMGMLGDNELMVWGNGTAIQRWNVNNYSICYATSPSICSDIRLKKDFKNLSNSLASIVQLKGYNYYLKNEKNANLQTGFIAQEIQKILPELVQTGSDGYLSVDYIGLIPHLVEAVKELKKENDSYKNRIENLEKWVISKQQETAIQTAKSSK